MAALVLVARLVTLNTRPMQTSALDLTKPGKHHHSHLAASVDGEYSKIMARPWFRYFRNLRETEITKFLSRHPKLSLGQVLDLGCADSVHLQLFPDDSLKIGVDPSMEALQTSGKSVGSCLAAGDAASIPLKDKSINFVLASGLIHHVHGFLEEVMREVFRVLVPGGVLYIDEPNGRNPLWKLVLMSPIGREVDEGGTKPFTVPQMLKSANQFEHLDSMFYGLSLWPMWAVRWVVVLRKPWESET